ncbi:MAG: OsmC family peroxiredoxin [Acidobacteria bacterium]|nr:OsmC family peroxiredoxin [Acidobacteriota bacterium]
MPVEIEVSFRQTGPSTTEASIRSHAVVVDRPESKGGADQGPMGGELLLAGLGGCFLSNLLAAARARETPLSDVRAQVTGTLDGTPPRFTAMTIALEATADPDQIQKLAAIAEKGCIVANTIRPAVALTITVQGASAA